MSTRGRRASRPAETHRRPVPLSPGGLVVEHRDRQGLVRSYDFATLEAAPAMQRSWAVLFAGACAPGGGWDSRSTSEDNFSRLARFASFLARQDEPPGDIGGLTPAHWTAWKVSRPATTYGYVDVTKIAAFLRKDPRLRPDTRAAMAKRLAVAKPRETAFTEAEFLQARTAARKMFRSAHRRIAENAQVLASWRSGELEPGTGQWLLGEALDVLARTGDVPRSAGGKMIYRYRRPLGGGSIRAARERLFLNKTEAAALAVLLTAELGLNATTVSEMPAPRATPDSGEGGAPTYRLELEKRRRGSGRHFETRNITDLGPRDEDGNHLSQGLLREVPWVAIPPVVTAIRVLERITPEGLLFASAAHDFSSQRSRAGAPSPPAMGRRIEGFVSWANTLADSHGRPHETIPADPHGALGTARFRRTLAWHIARRPGGLVALAIQYGHLRTAMSGHYASRGRDGIHDLLDIETARATADALTALNEDLAAGGAVSGPAARRAINAAAQAPAYAGAIITARDARNLLGNPALAVHDNPRSLLLCVYDPHKALCRREGRQDTPSLDRCVATCANISRTDRHADLLTRKAELLDKQADGLTPEPLAERLRARAGILRAHAEQHHQTRITAQENPR